MDCENGTGHRQVFDAFGNVIGDFVLLRCASDHDWTDDPCHLSCVDYPPTPPCPREAPLPVSRMQTGGFNWRGNEGSITDRVLEDMPDTETYELRWSAYERPSTGFVYMQARYYEPATGRFLTADAVAYGLETVLTGQNNRWVYCGNDPVNCSDPSGHIALGFVLLIAFMLGMIVGAMMQAAGIDVAGSVTAMLAGLMAALGGAFKLTNKCGPPAKIHGGWANFFSGMLMTMGLDMSMIGAYGGGVIAAAALLIAGAFLLGVALGGFLYESLAFCDPHEKDRFEAPPGRMPELGPYLACGRSPRFQGAV